VVPPDIPEAPEPARPAHAADASRRAALAALAEAGDAAAIAEHVLAEGRVGPHTDSDEDDAVLGRTADLLGQHLGDSAMFVAWVAAVANGVTDLEGIEAWSHRAVRAAVRDPTRRPVLWSEVRRGDLVVAEVDDELRAAVALDGLWGVHVGARGIERVALVDLVDGADGPRVLRDKLWFWSSFAAPDGGLGDPSASEAASPPTFAAPHGQPAASALWLLGAAMAAIVALVFGVVVLGDRVGDRRDAPGPVPRASLFPLDRLTLLERTVGDSDLQLCTDGVPTGPYDGELRGIRIRGVDTYRFDSTRLLVDVTFLEPLHTSLRALERRAVRGYAVDAEGVPRGIVQRVEVTPDGTELRGGLDLEGRPVDSVTATVAVDDGFQFLLDLRAAHSETSVRVAVDSLGSMAHDLGSLPCHTVVTAPIDLTGA
jgi:hypothetical protein